MQRIKSGLTALAVGIVLLAALDWAAAAATGQSMVLGKWNQADQTTTIKNVGSGPALDIRAKGPAFAVHNTNRIKNLNADKLDGKDAAALAASKQTVYIYGARSRVGAFPHNLPAQPEGSYLVAYSAQFVGAAGSLANPNTVTCHITVSTVVGTTATTKGILAEAQVASIESPPAVSGVGTLWLAAGDQVALVCTMSRPNQQWSTSALQPIQVTFLHTDGITAVSAPLGRSANR
jgi:hypothetical protein